MVVGSPHAIPATLSIHSIPSSPEAIILRDYYKAVVVLNANNIADWQLPTQAWMAGWRYVVIAGVVAWARRVQQVNATAIIQITTNCTKLRLLTSLSSVLPSSPCSS